MTRDKRDLSTTSSEVTVWAESLKGARKRYDRAYMMLGATLRLSHTVEDDACAPGHSRLRRVSFLVCVVGGNRSASDISRRYDSECKTDESDIYASTDTGWLRDAGGDAGRGAG